jgi:hypothetical protein
MYSIVEQENREGDSKGAASKGRKANPGNQVKNVFHAGENNQL